MPPSKKNPIPESGSGTWPVFLAGGQLNWFAGQGAQIVVNPEYRGPLIVRGGRLDAPGAMPLEPLATHGAVEFGPSTSSEWRQWQGRIATRIDPGCYGLQADGFTFTTQIVFLVRGGQPPGG